MWFDLTTAISNTLPSVRALMVSVGHAARLRSARRRVWAEHTEEILAELEEL